jgi:hypothetical protein
MRFQEIFDYALAAQSFAGRYVGHEYTGFCLSNADANILATSFGQTISNYTTELAVQLFTNDFTDQSDSVNSLIQNSPLPNIPVSSTRHPSYSLLPASNVSGWMDLLT